MRGLNTLDIFKLFVYKEGRLLAGKNFYNFGFLYFIFFITFVAIGFANGSRSYLEEKMSDFFIRWVPVMIPLDKSEITQQIINDLTSDDSAKRAYFYQKVTGNNFGTLKFWDFGKIHQNNGTFRKYGQSIDISNNLLGRISEKLRFGGIFKSAEDMGIIVTDKLLEDLHYPINTPYILMAAPDASGKIRHIPVPITGVVRKELPGNTDFMVTQYFYNNRFFIDTKSPFNASFIRGVELLTTEPPDKAEKMMAILKSFFSSDLFFKKYQISVDVVGYKNAYIECNKIIVSLNPDSSLTVRDSIYSTISRISELRNFSWCRFYDFHRRLQSSFILENKYDMIYIQFSRLDSIAAFRDFLLKKHSIQIDMADIETRKNYNFISNLTGIISLILILFSIMSICLFISNVLRLHLQKIKMNIGTFSAFGINPKMLDRIYRLIMLSFIVLSMATGYLSAAVFGYFGGIRKILRFLHCNLEPHRNYFELSSLWTFLTIIFVILLSIISLKITSNKIFYQTPGDLIYDRDENA